MGSDVDVTKQTLFDLLSTELYEPLTEHTGANADNTPRLRRWLCAQRYKQISDGKALHRWRENILFVRISHSKLLVRHGHLIGSDVSLRTIPSESKLYNIDIL